MTTTPTRPRSTLLTILVLWAAFYCTFALVRPALLDDADSVHAEVAREMLLRHDPVTLYANGIRYLEKAPLLYWSMAASMRVSQALGFTSPDAFAAAARIPLALSVLGLALCCEALARRMYRSTRAGLYAALIVLSSFGIFLFSRITLPDTAVCFFTTLALYFFWRGEEEDPVRFRWRAGFAFACALNVLSKGLIGVVFPVAIALLFVFVSRGFRGALTRLRPKQELYEIGVFLLIAAPWHILAGLANPTQGHPAPFDYINGHWQVPLPTDGNVRGWFWFYFMNEHLLRYLNLRIPRDYDTSPLWLFWGLCLVWLMPWSAFLFHALADPLKQWFHAIRVRVTTPRRLLDLHTPQPDRAQTLLLLWAALPLLFFSLSTRQEYYVLPALPAFALLIAGWLARQEISKPSAEAHRRSAARCTRVLLAFGALFAAATIYFLLHTRAPAPNTDLATLLAQNPGDYALSMGHFLDLNAQALGLFRLPLAIAALSLFFGPLAAVLLRNTPALQMSRLPLDILLIKLFGKRVAQWQGRKPRVHAATLALAAGAFGFLLAAHLGLQTFAPVLTSAQLAKAIAPQVHKDDLVVIHGEYEAGSTLGFYLQRPNDYITDCPGPRTGLGPHECAMNTIHILEGRSSNLWYGSFFPDAPPIFETPESLAAKWPGPQRIFMWQSLTDPPNQLPTLPGPVYILVQSGGKEIVSNQPNR